MSRNPQSAPDNARATRILMALTLVFVLVFVLSIGLIGYLVVRTDRGTVAEGSYLHVPLSGVLEEAPMVGGLLLDPELAPILVTEYSAAIQQAAEEDGIPLPPPSPEPPRDGGAGSARGSARSGDGDGAAPPAPADESAAGADAPAPAGAPAPASIDRE